jgi:2-amino-4-hydroxy-6-hydroxymethyldihydropteridine diphosphokinase
MGIEGGPDFLNGVAEIKTCLPPRILLEHLLAIELQHGRERLKAQGAKGYLSRTLDLDLLLYGDEVIVEEGLAVPHPRMMEREFVLKPLAELGINFHPDKVVPKHP